MKFSASASFLVAAAIALAALAAYVAEFTLFSRVREDASAAFSEVARIENENQAIARAKEAIAALEGDEASVASHFVSPDAIVPFLESLERSGEELGTEVEVVSVSSPGESDGRIALALGIKGSFAAVMRTLGTLEYGNEDLRLSSLTLDTLSTDEGSTWTAAATFSVATLTKAP